MSAAIGIVGTGHVGMAAASSVFGGQLASEVVLVDLDRERAIGEALDLMHGQALVGPCEVRAGGYADLADVACVVLTAGVGQQPGETRTDLLQRNVEVFRSIMAELDRHAPDAVVLVATNPVDILTLVAQELSERDPNRILGTGTVLDSARLRAILGSRYGVSPQSVHASVLGEHGDTEFVPWSLAAIGSVPVMERELFGVAWDPDEAERIETRVRTAAYEIIDRKGHTNWAIGAVIADLLTAVLRDEQIVVPVSVRTGGAFGCADVCLGLPARVGAGGVSGVVLPPLTEREVDRLRHSAGTLAALVEQLRL